MFGKKKITIIFIIILIILIGLIIYHLFIKDREISITEYTPQEEISEKQMRTTLVSLYFKNGQELVQEARMVDVKELIDNPYNDILQMLIDGPKSENLKNAIPEGTKINKLEKDEDILIIDFSREFVENHIGGEDEEKLTMQAILKTLTELTEINGIKIKIDGEENKCFKDEKINFKNTFIRE